MADHDEKDKEIREYSIRENVFFGALIYAEMRDQLDHLSSEEVMAEVIAIAEQFEEESPDGTSEQFNNYCRDKLKKLRQ